MDKSVCGSHLRTLKVVLSQNGANLDKLELRRGGGKREIMSWSHLINKMKSCFKIKLTYVIVLKTLTWVYIIILLSSGYSNS